MRNSHAPSGWINKRMNTQIQFDNIIPHHNTWDSSFYSYKNLYIFLEFVDIGEAIYEALHELSHP